jgi:hypothetical protein
MGVPLGLFVHDSTTIGPNQVFSGIPARSIVEQILQLAQGVNNVPMGYLVTPSKVLHYFKLSSYSFVAPGNVTDVTPTPGGSVAVENLTLEYDESEIVNAVFVRGSSASTSGQATDTASVAKYGVRQALIDEPRATSVALSNQYGVGYLVDHKEATLRGNFEVDGTFCDAPALHWFSDQNITITNSALSLSAAAFRTYAVETWWLGGNGAHRHKVHFGGLPRSGLARIIRALTTSGITPLGSAALPISGRKVVGTIGAMTAMLGSALPILAAAIGHPGVA